MKGTFSQLPCFARAGVFSKRVQGDDKAGTWHVSGCSRRLSFSVLNDIRLEVNSLILR